MNNKPATAYIAAAAVLLAALLVASLLAKQEGYQNLLLVTPSGFGAQGLNPEKLDEFSVGEFLLTYEIKRTVTAQAINSKHTVTLVGTNQNYADIMRYAVLDGGFLTKAAWDAEKKHVALNETAAFRLFGSNSITGQALKLNGEPWIITGVIDDNDTENANAYAPSSVTGGQADSLIAMMDGKAVSEAYVKNSLKDVGIREDSYAFVNLSKSACAFQERFSIAWQSALLAAIVLFVLRAGGGIAQSFRFYRSKLREIYFRELFVCYGTPLVKTAVALLLLVVGVISALLLSLRILEACLTWRELVPLTGELAAGSFIGKLAWLRKYQWIDAAVFTVYIGTILLILILYVIKQSMKEQVRSYGADNPDC